MKIILATIAIALSIGFSSPEFVPLEPLEMQTRDKLAEPYTGEIFKVTAYDLSVASCGKTENDPYYGVTRSGYSLVGHTRESAMTIAVDPNIIPLESKVEVTFINEKYKKYDGIYTAYDTGGAVKGRIIDVFLGEELVNIDFGITKAKVRVIK